VRVHEEDLDIHRLLGERHLEAVLESLLHPGRLLFHLPLLEQSGEGIGIQALPRLRIQDADLAVSLEQRLGEILPSACPFGGTKGLLEINGLVGVVAAEDVVEAEGGVFEECVEIRFLRFARNDRGNGMTE
jgi:hypothetical protein